MPLIRKILKVGGSRAVAIPKSWIDNAENKAGKKIVALSLKLNGSITLQPIFETRKRVRVFDNASK